MTKAELKGLRYANYRITNYEERIEVLRSRMESVTRSMENTPVQSSLNDKLAEQLSLLDEWEREVEEKRTELYLLQMEAAREFERLPDGQREVMTARYIDCLTWEQVAEKTNYSISHCYRLYRKYKDEIK